MNQANDIRHYSLLTIGIIVGIVGVYLRFLNDTDLISYISNILLVIGTVICFKAVFAIMK
jgi:tetrahydromethanopterin S-methyltransferase subunit C